jgi:hypothetical protein
MRFVTRNLYQPEGGASFQEGFYAQKAKSDLGHAPNAASVLWPQLTLSHSPHRLSFIHKFTGTTAENNAQTRHHHRQPKKRARNITAIVGSRFSSFIVDVIHVQMKERRRRRRHFMIRNSN